MPVVYRVAYTPVPDDPPERGELLPYISPDGATIGSSPASGSRT